MQNSAIQLERYFFEELSFSLDTKFDADAPENENLFSTPLPLEKLHHDVELAVDSENSRHRMYLLSVSSQAASGELPCSFKARVLGFFAVGNDCPEESVDRVADVNCAAILYGIAREALANLTGRGPWPPIILPAVHFLDLKFEPNSVEAELPQPKPKKAARKRKTQTSS